MATSAIFDSWGRRKAKQELEEKWYESNSCDIERVNTIGLCVSRFLSEKNLFHVKIEKRNKKAPTNSKGTWHHQN